VGGHARLRRLRRRAAGVLAGRGGEDEGWKVNPAADLHGRCFGDLVVLDRAPTPDGARGCWWRCECECGLVVHRSSSALLTGERRGAAPACHECGREVAGGRAFARRARRQEQMHAHLADLWASDQTLWTWRDELAMREDVLMALEREFGPIDDAPALPLMTLGLCSGADVLAAKDADLDIAKAQESAALRRAVEQEATERRDVDLWKASMRAQVGEGREERRKRALGMVRADLARARALGMVP
jgi:hypothetical protein